MNLAEVFMPLLAGNIQPTDLQRWQQTIDSMVTENKVTLLVTHGLFEHLFHRQAPHGARDHLYICIRCYLVFLGTPCIDFVKEGLKEATVVNGVVSHHFHYGSELCVIRASKRGDGVEFTACLARED
jgi:hypothetical protein